MACMWPLRLSSATGRRGGTWTAARNRLGIERAEKLVSMSDSEKEEDEGGHMVECPLWG